MWRPWTPWSSLRVGSDTLIRALDSGLSLDDMNALLGAPTSAVPQPLSQLLEDLARRLGEVEVQQGCRLVKARTESWPTSCCSGPSWPP